MMVVHNYHKHTQIHPQVLKNHPLPKKKGIIDGYPFSAAAPVPSDGVNHGADDANEE